MKKLLIIFFLVIVGISNNKINSLNTKENIWLKTYKNYKNYNTIISKISKVQHKIKYAGDNLKTQEKLYKSLSLYQSKLSLYEKNNSFDTILKDYKYTTTTHINLREYLFQNRLEKLDKTITKYLLLKNKFYVAQSTIKNIIQIETKEKKHKPSFFKEDLEYFNEYSENVEKTYQNLLEEKDELRKKYAEYKSDVLVKHLITLAVILLVFIIYKLAFLMTRKFASNSSKNYDKFLSLLFFLTIILIILMRYIEDFLYFITFLSVIAAALTIATREIILNIAGAIYIFFSSMVKVGDRVMVQFETKHTIGDIVEISLAKIKLLEVDDYTNIKEVKSVGRTIYIPNSYIFTKVFYNYSLQERGNIHELLELEFDLNSDFELIESVVRETLQSLSLSHKISFTLNNLKTGISATISYKTHYKNSSKNRSLLLIQLIKNLKNHPQIKLKNSKKSPKEAEGDGE